MKITKDTVEEKLVDGTKAALFVAALLGGATLSAKALTFIGRNTNKALKLLTKKKHKVDDYVEDIVEEFEENWDDYDVVEPIATDVE